MTDGNSFLTFFVFFMTMRKSKFDDKILSDYNNHMLFRYYNKSVSLVRSNMGRSNAVLIDVNQVKIF